MTVRELGFRSPSWKARPATIGLAHTVLVMRDGAITHRTDASPGKKPRQVDLIGHMV